MGITFRYFADPHHFSTYSADPKTCDICHRHAPGYDGPYYGTHDITFVCEVCLHQGRLAEIGAHTNDGSSATLRADIRQLHPELSDAKCDGMAAERYAEVTQSTPHALTWQDFFWPTHCDDYCRYVKEIGKGDIAELAPDEEGWRFIEAYARDLYGTATARDLWEGLRPDKPVNGETSYSLGMYLFQCLTCGEYVILWDMD